MRSFFLFCLKAALGGFIALVVLSAFCFFYDNSPVVVEQPSGITNYHYASNASWYYGTEGFGFGRTNNLGYNDAQDLTDDSSAIIAFLGSSHTQAFQVPQKHNFVTLTQAKLLKDSNPENDLQCLNLGISSHYLNTTLSNYSYLFEEFDNIKYSVIETHTLNYSADEITATLNETYHKPLKVDGKFSKLLQKVPVLRVPFLRTLKKQMDRVDRKEEQATRNDATDSLDYDAYGLALDALFAKIHSIAEANNTQPIILYHHHLQLDNFQGLIKTDDPRMVEIFRQACQRHSIHFIDMTEDFIAHFNETHQAPYGFMNTSMAEGHLNTVGHELISKAIFEKICELEERN